VVVLAFSLGVGHLALAAPIPDGLADPMQPLHPVVTAAPEENAAKPALTWLLQGVKIDRHHRSALINGQVVRVGEMVDGARIVKIENDGVIIESGEQPSTLRLLKHEIKKRSRTPR
jgi:MSHA biogenesis protein MshK